MEKYPNAASRMQDTLRVGKMVGLRVLKKRCQNTDSYLATFVAVLQRLYRALGFNLRTEYRVQPVHVDGQAPGLKPSQRCRLAHLAPKDVRRRRMRVQ
jgi:hypothetical protein